MDKNMKLAIGFRGDLNLTAQAVPLQEGYLKIGGIVDSSADKGLKFGVVVSATPTDVSIHAPVRERQPKLPGVFADHRFQFTLP